MTIQPGVRQQSAPMRSYFEMFSRSAAIGYADFVLYPNAAQKTLASIQVVVPYDNHKTVPRALDDSA